MVGGSAARAHPTELESTSSEFYAASHTRLFLLARRPPRARAINLLAKAQNKKADPLDRTIFGGVSSALTCTCVGRFPFSSPNRVDPNRQASRGRLPRQPCPRLPSNHATRAWS